MTPDQPFDNCDPSETPVCNELGKCFRALPAEPAKPEGETTQTVDEAYQWLHSVFPTTTADSLLESDKHLGDASRLHNMHLFAKQKETELAQLRAEAKRLGQLNTNSEWLRRMLDTVQHAVAPEFRGTWQDRIEESVKRVTALRAENERLREWLPIETAPKDGTRILACVDHPTLYSPCTVVWATYHPNAKGDFTWRSAPICGDKMDRITHWMPLPAAPTEPTDKEGGAS